MLRLVKAYVEFSHGIFENTFSLLLIGIPFLSFYYLYASRTVLNNRHSFVPACSILQLPKDGVDLVDSSMAAYGLYPPALAFLVQLVTLRHATSPHC